MSKYIDADRLKAEIESRMGNYDANSKNPNQLLWAELAALIPFIDSLQQEQPSEDLEAKAAQYESYFDVGEQHGYLCVNKGEMAEAFKDGARWQKEQDESRRIANIQLANTDTPVDTEMEVAFNDIWRDAEVIVERDGTLDEKATELMKAVCHDFFESGKEWQKERMGEQARKELAKTDITLADLVAFDEGCKIGRRLERQDMLKDAVEGIVVCDETTFGYKDIVVEIPDTLNVGDKVKIVIVPIKEE